MAAAHKKLELLIKANQSLQEENQHIKERPPQSPPFHLEPIELKSSRQKSSLCLRNLSFGFDEREERTPYTLETLGDGANDRTTQI